MSFWTWALAAYAHPDAEAACLALQDEHGQNVPLLLWAAWASQTGLGVDVPKAAEIARDWEHRIGAPLRQARRALKTPAAGIDEAARLALREQVKAVELAAEKALMTALESLPAEGAASSGLDALRAASGAWGEAAPEAALERLALALISW